MKSLLLTLVLGSWIYIDGQTSIQFSDPQPTGKSAVYTVDPSLFGRYKSNNSSTTYEFSAEGIAIISVIVNFVTHEQVRESSALEVRNDYLFGIKENDSVPCFLEGDKYYYGTEHKKWIVQKGLPNVLYQLDAKKYIINFKEDNNFEPSLVEFVGNQLNIKHGETVFQQEYAAVQKKTAIKRYGQETLLLTPDQLEWSKLFPILFKSKSLVYLKA